MPELTHNKESMQGECSEEQNISMRASSKMPHHVDFAWQWCILCIPSCMTIASHNPFLHALHAHPTFPHAWSLPGSLTHWKKWYPSLFSGLKMTPFLWQNTYFLAQNDPFFAIKHWLFSPKWTSLLAVNTDFSAQMNPPFHGKTLDIKINPFFSKFTEVSPKIPPFSRKMRILDFLKKYPFIHKFKN